MTIIYVSGSAASNPNTTGLTSISVNRPSGIVVDNLLVAFVYGGSAATTPVFTGPADWTKQGETLGHTNQGGGMGVFTKKATATEPASYTFGGPGFLVVNVLQFSGTESLDGAPGFVWATTTNPMTSPLMTSTVAGDHYILGCGSRGAASFSVPTGTSALTSAVTTGTGSLYTFDGALGAPGSSSYSVTASTASGQVFGAVLLTPSVPPNSAPTANAGPDQSVAAGATVTLTGTDSDPDNNITTRAWTQTSGPAVTLSGAATATATFTAPSLSTSSTLTFSYTVTDAGGLTATDTMTVTVAKATVDRLRLGAGTVALRLGANPVDKVYLGNTLVWP